MRSGGRYFFVTRSSFSTFFENQNTSHATMRKSAPAPRMIAVPPPQRTATPRSALPLATIVLWSVAWPARAPAQLYAGLDAAFASRYVWRGVTRVDGAALQPEGYLGLQLADGYLSAGAWGSYELSRAGPSGLSDLGPGRTGFGEIDYWSQYARALA